MKQLSKQVSKYQSLMLTYLITNWKLLNVKKLIENEYKYNTGGGTFCQLSQIPVL